MIRKAFIKVLLAVLCLTCIGIISYKGSKQIDCIPKVTTHLATPNANVVSLSTEDDDFITPEVTVVSAFFDIGTFSKGYKHVLRGKDEYMTWIQAFKSLDNPVVFYTDSKFVYDTFAEVRNRFSRNRTKIHLIKDRTKLLWSFSIFNDIKVVYKQPHYPIHYPNTVNENYTCLTHAKFELLNKVIKDLDFQTKYLTWVDVGLFRHRNYSETFHVVTPPKLEEDKVAVLRVLPYKERSVTDIVKGKKNWVGGGMVFGRWDTLLTFTEDYMKAVRILLEHKLMNVEQQVLYSMYTKSFYFTPRVKLQVYYRGKDMDWFGLEEITAIKGYYIGSQTMYNTSKLFITTSDHN